MHGVGDMGLTGQAKVNQSGGENPCRDGSSSAKHDIQCGGAPDLQPGAHVLLTTADSEESDLGHPATGARQGT